MNWEKVRFENDGGRKTVILRNPRETSLFLSGVEVDKFNEEVAPRDVDQRVHIIQLECIVWRKPLVQNPKYAELEEA